MRTKLTLAFLIVIVSSLLVINEVEAQEQEKPHVFVVTTWKSTMPHNGTTAERDSLLMLWHNNVTMKNDLILSVQNFKHGYGSDLRDWVVVVEFAEWAHITEAAEKDTELAKNFWKTDEEMQEFWKKFLKYWDTHSDEIYWDVPEFNKGR